MEPEPDRDPAINVTVVPVQSNKVEGVIDETTGSMSNVTDEVEREILVHPSPG
jgi:hypothetical protein